MTDQPQPPDPDSPAPLEPDGAASGSAEPDAGRTVARQVPVTEPEPAAEDTPPAEPEPTVVRGTLPASPPPDAAPASEPGPPAASETYAKPSAPSPTEWTPSVPAREPDVSGDGDGDGTTPTPARGAATAIFDERPEVAVGGAFAGGLVLALILKRLAR